MSDQSIHEHFAPGVLPITQPPGLPSRPNQRWQAPASETDLAQYLHMRLDVDVVIRRFAQVILAQFPHDGFRYRHPEHAIEIDQGRQSRHECSYRLTLNQEYLGEIFFRRGKRFREPELSHLESLLGHLLFPLRNALLYLKALRAAQTDPLTGLFNRAGMEKMLPRELASSARAGEHLALFVLDLDHFKQINDQLGHSIGDEVLQRMADCLRIATRESDLLFRCGGEEFVVLMHLRDPVLGYELGQRMLDMIRTCRGVQSLVPAFSITASIGWAIARPDESPRELFDRADRAMYVAKSAGRDCLIAAH